ncbi:MAG TPA: hypothetical protein VF653_05520 [Methylomirabilota bacterium]
MDRRAFVSVVIAGMAAIASGAAAQGGPPSGGRPRWGQDAEKEFGLGRGLGPKLMTEEEWKEHHEKMRTLTGEERERYRRETHEKMRERAKERGIAMPAEPGPHGRGMGSPGGPPKR